MNNHRTIKSKIASGLAIVLLSGFGAAHAATWEWANSGSGDYLISTNWTNSVSPFTNGLPASGDTAINNIAGSTTTISGSDAVTVGTLQAQTGTVSMSGGTLGTPSTLATVQTTGSNGLFTVSGGTLSLGSLQMTGNYSTISLSGGTTTVTTDSRIAAANCAYNVSGSAVLYLSKLVLGSAATSDINNVMTVSGNAVVNQNQTGSTGELWIGGNNGGSGTLILKNSAVWTNSFPSEDIEVGRAVSGAGTGVFTIQDSAIFYHDNVLNVAQNASGTGAVGTVNLNGGTVYVTGFLNDGGIGTINANGGAVTALAASANFFNGFNSTGGNNSVNLQSGGLTFNTGGNAVTITNTLSGVGGFTALGGGTLTLTASNTYSGATAVDNSTLILTNAGAIASGTSLTLSNATLQFGITQTFPTNFVTGTFATPGPGPSTISISSFTGSGTPPFQFTIIKYATAGAGLVGPNNVLTNLELTLPSANGLTGYLTNNAAKGSIDLVMTGGTYLPQIVAQPSPITRYTNFTGQFTVTALAATSYRWQRNNVNISDGGNVYGTASNVLTITNISPTNAANYDVVVANSSGSVTSSAVALSIETPDCNYETAVVSNYPVAYYRFNETVDPTSNPNVPAFDYAGGYNGVYGSTDENGTDGINGPMPSGGFPGFDSDNGAAEFFPTYPSTSLVAVSNGYPVSTNTVTMLGWVYPMGTETNFDGIIINRGTNVAGLTYSGDTDTNGNFTLGYIWNDDANTYGWNSGLVPPANQWSMVALVVTPTNATIYMGGTNGLTFAVHTYDHVVQTLNGLVSIGADTFTGQGSRVFNGNVDEVAVFNQALTEGQLTTILGAAVGTTNFPPKIVVQPQSQTAVVPATVQFTVAVAGTFPLAYQWEVGTNGVYTDLTDGGRISGSQTATLTITNLALTDPTNFIVVITNATGSVTSSPVTLTILSTWPVVTLTANDPSGTASFTTAGDWSNDAAPSPSNDYLDIGFQLRTPTSGNATFAGNSLTLSNGAVLAIKTGGTITVGSSPATGLFVDNSSVANWTGGLSTFGGYVTLETDGGTFDPQIFAILDVSAVVGGPGALIVAGDTEFGGTVVLQASNSYSGGTFINAIDTLQLSGSGTLGSANNSLTMNVTQGVTGSQVGTLDLDGTSQAVGNLTGNASATILDSASSTASTLTIGNGNGTGGNFQGVIANGSGTVTLAKVGTGTIALSGANTYTGPTLVDGGTLALSGSGSLSGTPVIAVASGATFDVSGLSSTLSLGSSQALAGPTATGTINGSLNMGSGSLTLNYASGTPTLTVANGTLTLNNNAVTVTNTGAALPPGSYLLVSKGTGGSVAGSVAGSSVTVAGSGVAGGAHASLNISSGALYLTVATQSFYITNVWNGSTLTLSWPAGDILLQASNLLGPWTTNNATSPYVVTPTNGHMFYRAEQ